MLYENDKNASKAHRECIDCRSTKSLRFVENVSLGIQDRKPMLLKAVFVEAV